MKKLLAVCAALLTVLSTCAAGERDSALPPYLSADAVARYIIQAGCGVDPGTLEPVHMTRDQQTVTYYMTEIYGLEEGSWTEAAIYRAGGAEAFEIAVVRTGDKKTASRAADALEDYIEAREGDFTGYEPEQADIVHHSEAAWSEYGDAALLICADAETAELAFQYSYDGLLRQDFNPPGKDDMTIYDTSAILEAWSGGDRTGLSEKDAAILDMAEQVIGEVTTEDMSEYERERALYEWETGHAVYDQDHYDVLSLMDPDSHNPYGLFYNGKAICIGFASTFQLLMDMTGVECVTVIGASRDSTADHAWNMVRLDGKWYCADPTWDVEKPPEEWDYFNVTSDWMAATDHQWDYDGVPEATAADHGVPAREDA